MTAIAAQPFQLTGALRGDRSNQVRAVQIGRLVAGARPADNRRGGEQSPTLLLSGLTDAQRAAVADRAGHVREVLTGYQAGHPDGAAAGEPRTEYTAGAPLKARYRAKARELDVGSERWSGG